MQSQIVAFKNALEANKEASDFHLTIDLFIYWYILSNFCVIKEWKIFCEKIGIC